MRYFVSAFFIFFLIAACKCGNPSYSPNCSEVLSPSQSTFTDVYPLFTDKGKSSCSNCHSTSNPTSNYDLSTKPGVYDALNNHFDVIYAQVASGMMPANDLPHWTDAELQTLSSWYCHGGFYDQ